jgi:hypothetical protein
MSYAIFMLQGRFCRLVWEDKVYIVNDKDNQVFITEGLQMQNIKVIKF